MHAKNTRSLISWQRDGAGGQAHLPQTGKRSFEASICEQQDDKTQPNIAQEHLSHCRKSFSSFRFSIVAGTILKLDDVPLNYFPLYAEYTYVYVDIFFPLPFLFLDQDTCATRKNKSYASLDRHYSRRWIFSYPTIRK